MRYRAFVNETKFALEESSIVVGKTQYVYFIGGSTMAGKGISGQTYPMTYSKIMHQSVSVRTRYLIQLFEVLELVKHHHLTGDLFLNCGAGDEMRLIDQRLARILPKHWSMPAHMEPPIHFSGNRKRRFKQLVIVKLKYVIKTTAAICGMYKSITPRFEYEGLVSDFAKIAALQNLKVHWIETALGNSNIPRFIRREKRLYCEEIFLKNLAYFPKGSSFVAIREKIALEDLLDDSFHLSQSGHFKIGNILAEVKLSTF
jgi:hypothetical protein